MDKNSVKVGIFPAVQLPPWRAVTVVARFIAMLCKYRLPSGSYSHKPKCHIPPKRTVVLQYRRKNTTIKIVVITAYRRINTANFSYRPESTANSRYRPESTVSSRYRPESTATSGYRPKHTGDTGYDQCSFTKSLQS